jgi:hypothetical protein
MNGETRSGFGSRLVSSCVENERPRLEYESQEGPGERLELGKVSCGGGGQRNDAPADRVVLPPQTRSFPIPRHPYSCLPLHWGRRSLQRQQLDKRTDG